MAPKPYAEGDTHRPRLGRPEAALDLNRICWKWHPFGAPVIHSSSCRSVATLKEKADVRLDASIFRVPFEFRFGKLSFKKYIFAILRIICS